jgi:hypothetical protein
MLTVKLWENPWNIDVSDPKALLAGAEVIRLHTPFGSDDFVEGPELISQSER